MGAKPSVGKKRGCLCCCFGKKPKPVVFPWSHWSAILIYITDINDIRNISLVCKDMREVLLRSVEELNYVPTVKTVRFKLDGIISSNALKLNTVIKMQFLRLFKGVQKVRGCLIPLELANSNELTFFKIASYVTMIQDRQELFAATSELLLIACRRLDEYRIINIYQYNDSRGSVDPSSETSSVNDYHSMIKKLSSFSKTTVINYGTQGSKKRIRNIPTLAIGSKDGWLELYGIPSLRYCLEPDRERYVSTPTMRDNSWTEGVQAYHNIPVDDDHMDLIPMGEQVEDMPVRTRVSATKDLSSVTKLLISSNSWSGTPLDLTLLTGLKEVRFGRSFILPANDDPLGLMMLSNSGSQPPLLVLPSPGGEDGGLTLDQIVMLAMSTQEELEDAKEISDVRERSISTITDRSTIGRRFASNDGRQFISKDDEHRELSSDDTFSLGNRSYGTSRSRHARPTIMDIISEYPRTFTPVDCSQDENKYMSDINALREELTDGLSTDDYVSLADIIDPDIKMFIEIYPESDLTVMAKCLYRAYGTRFYIPVIVNE